jgi:hypothetical protein
MRNRDLGRKSNDRRSTSIRYDSITYLACAFLKPLCTSMLEFKPGERVVLNGSSVNCTSVMRRGLGYIDPETICCSLYSLNGVLLAKDPIKKALRLTYTACNDDLLKKRSPLSYFHHRFIYEQPTESDVAISADAMETTSGRASQLAMQWFQSCITPFVNIHSTLKPERDSTRRWQQSKCMLVG